MAVAIRWVVGICVALFVVGLLAYARGHVHHHGDDVGAGHTPVVAVRSAVV